MLIHFFDSKYKNTQTSSKHKTIVTLSCRAVLLWHTPRELTCILTEKKERHRAKYGSTNTQLSSCIKLNYTEKHLELM